MDKILEKITELRDKLNYHNYKYYIENAPEISDREFDRMLAELQELEAAHPEYADPNSPTNRIGSDLTSRFRQVTHRYPMLSLANTYSLEELRSFYDRVEQEAEGADFVCELKYDGVAISITYEKGKLLQAVTRGDGFVGDDVTSNIRTVRSIPLQLRGGDYPDHFEVRGEIFMLHASFDKLNREREENGEPLFANPRNATAGTLKQQSSAVVARRGLDSFMYYVIGNDLPFDTHWENINKAREWGFKISDKMELCKGLGQMEKFVKKADELRHGLPYDTDGVAIKVNEYEVQRRMGSTAKAPRWAIAYKFQAEQALTKLLSVSFQVGRTGAITPVANLDPVLLAGTVVKRASVYNAEQMRLLDLRIGDMVYVEKGGEIIPKITGVDFEQRPKESKPLEFIDKCPECGTPLVRIEDEARHYCPNQSDCPPQVIGRIIHFASRRAMDIEGLGDETVTLLYREKLISDVADLYDLTEEQLASLPRFGKKSAGNIIESIKGSVDIPFKRVLYAIGIRFVGETTAKNLAAHFGSLDAVMKASAEELSESEEVGGKIAQSIIDYFADESNRHVIERLRKAGLQFEERTKEPVSRLLSGMTFVISGTFDRYGRDELKDLIQLHGGKNLATVSSNTDFLIAGDKAGPSKLSKAKKLGIKTIGITEFEEMISPKK